MGCCSSAAAGARRSSLDDGANKELLETIKFLRDTPMFSRLHQQELPILAAAFKRQTFKKGQEVVRAGDNGAEFFVILKGSASMWLEPGQGAEPERLMSANAVSRSKTGMMSWTMTGTGSYSVGARASEMRWQARGSTGDRFRPSRSVASAAGGEAGVDSQKTTRRSISSATVAGDSSKTTRRSISSGTVAGEQSPKTPVSSAGSSGEICTPRTPSMLNEICGPVKLCNLRSRDYFGERALMLRERWEATVVAESDELQCLKISQSSCKKLRLLEQLKLPKRRRVLKPQNRRSCSPVEQTDRPRAKEASEAELVRDALLASEALSAHAGGDEHLLTALVTVAWKRELADGEVIVDPDENPAGCLFVVQEGRLAAHLLSEEQVEDMHEKHETPAFRRVMTTRCSLADALVAPGVEDDEPNVQKVMVDPGHCYGELSVLYEADHTAKVKSVGKAVVWAIDGSDLVEATALAAKARAESYAEILAEFPVFSGMLSEERLTLARSLVEKDFAQGQEIYREGDVGQNFYVLLEGEVVVRSGGKEVRTLTAKRGSEKHFGDHALAKGKVEPSSSAITAGPAAARCLLLARTAVDRLIKLESLPSQKTVVMASLNFDDVDIEDLKAVAVLGRGGFGFVELRQHPKTQSLYALKTIKKASVARTEHMKAQLQNEKYILEMTESGFITRLYQTSKSEQDIYFLLEACLGGELYSVYMSQKLFGKEDHARYYVASVALAFEHLHERYIIYRDLKPENLLLDQQGRLKVTDMGLAKFVVGKTYTVCGTPVYFSPEVARQTGYTVAVDWWALGILTWELLAAKTPFMAQSRGEALFWLAEQAVLQDLADPARAWPKAFTEGAKDCVRALLPYEPGERLPMQPGGLQLLKESLWFRQLDWSSLEAGTLKPPFKPPEVNLKKLAGFNNQVCMRPEEPYVDDGSGWDEDF